MFLIMKTIKILKIILFNYWKIIYFSIKRNQKENVEKYFFLA